MCIVYNKYYSYRYQLIILQRGNVLVEGPVNTGNIFVSIFKKNS